MQMQKTLFAKNSMRYVVAYNKIGRLRVRFGTRKFTETEGYGICNMLLAIRGVEKVTSTPVNGGILIVYQGTIKNQIVAALNSLDRKNLPADKPSQTQAIEKENQKFQNTIISIVVRKNIAKYIFPPSLRWAYTICAASKFIRRGVRSLWRGHINVDVLDSGAITAALLHNSPKTATSIMFLLSISDLLCDYTKFRASNILTQSLAINVERVWLVTENGDV